MQRKIGVGQLRPGMYISDLGADWLAHSFWRNSFAVGDEALIARIVASGIREVYIDPARGLDVVDAPTEVEVRAEVEREMAAIAVAVGPAPRVAVGDELRRARLISAEAVSIVRNVMNGARMGRQVQVEQVEPIVDRLAQSILRNPSALLYLARIKGKDDYTFQHSVAVCSLLLAFGRALGMDDATLRLAGIGGLLHDIGKVGIDDAVLNKPGRLTEAEFERMKAHAAVGAAILRRSGTFDELSVLVAEQHHERFDGSGYGAGLAGEAIAQVGQMAAICDVYDAITSDRVYRPALAPHQAMARIFEWSRFHFNPALVHQFLRVIGIYPVGALVRLESERLAVVVEQSASNLLQPVVRAFFDCRHRHPVSPVEIDLSRPGGRGGSDRIVAHELPETWGIELTRFL